MPSANIETGSANANFQGLTVKRGVERTATGRYPILQRIKNVLTPKILEAQNAETDINTNPTRVPVSKIRKSTEILRAGTSLIDWRASKIPEIPASVLIAISANDALIDTRLKTTGHNTSAIIEPMESQLAIGDRTVKVRAINTAAKRSRI
ncbi:hypothetical protein [Microbacterium sp. NPDC086615]|uniref:hypothetical protein n=1 Tax=Microbacterium sp. NPDC086615 TaxID=3154865 RepID=UPI00341D3481